MNDGNILFSKYELSKSLTLNNRVLMAPMTRVHADENFVPTQAMRDYYVRRSDAGLIITEGTIINSEARGHDNVPGIFTQEQINGWKNVTDAVHQNNGHMFLQIWHVGRVSHPSFLNGKLPISASATTMTGHISRSDLSFGDSRAATLDEIKSLIDDYAAAAKNAMTAGFDGVEIHGANGYLIDQFLHYSTNHRDDDYGGSAKNNARFALDVVKACGQLIGYERVGLRLSPGAYLNQIIGEKRDAETFAYLLQKLNQCTLAYVHTGNFNDSQAFEELNNMTMTDFIRSYYHGTLVAAGGYTMEAAALGIEQNKFDLVAIGRPFIANPDLIRRLQNHDSLNDYDVSMLAKLY